MYAGGVAKVWNPMGKAMKSFLYPVAVALVAFSGVVQAHAHLDKSVPAANSTLATAPRQVELQFNEAVRLTALTVQAGDAKPQEIGPLPKTTSNRITVPMPPLAAGSYTIAWRAVGGDSHVMSGKILFRVGAKPVPEGAAR
jgi:methionine-rich copper-binding protein CopC